MKILITGARAPGALHLARLLRSGGAEVVLADSVRFPLGRYTSDRFQCLRYPSPRFRRQEFGEFICSHVGRLEIDMVIPFCEEAVHLAVQCKAALGGKLMTAEADAMVRAHNKLEFIRHLEELGLPALETRQIKAGDRARGGTIIKPVWSRFAENVILDPAQADVDRLAPDEVWIEQQKAAGRELCATAFCTEGRVASFSCYEPKYRAGKGAGTFFQPAVSQRLEDIASSYAEATRWNGFLSFDAIEDDEVWPIECNPRGTSGIHLLRDGQGLLSAMCGGDSVRQSPAPAAVKLAIWTSLPKSIRSSGGGLTRLREDLSGANDALSFNGNSANKNALLLTCELALGALLTGTSLLGATTHDIAWDGTANPTRAPG